MSDQRHWQFAKKNERASPTSAMSPGCSVVRMPFVKQAQSPLSQSSWTSAPSLSVARQRNEPAPPFVHVGFAQVPIGGPASGGGGVDASATGAAGAFVGVGSSADGLPGGAGGRAGAGDSLGAGFTAAA